MGKASRKKKQEKPDVATLYAEGTCTRCAKRPRKKGPGMWCSMCITHARLRRNSRVRPPLTRKQLIDMLNAIEAELTANDTEEAA